MSRSDGTGPGAVILGLSPTGLYAVRELGRAGITVSGMSSEPQCGNASRYLHESLVEPDRARRLQTLISRFGGGSPRPVLIPTSDQDLEFVVDNAVHLMPHFAIQPSYMDGTASSVLTKASFYEICRAEGVDTPLSFEIARAQIATLKDRLSYPCLIKPSRIHELKAKMAGRKAWVARDAAEFENVERVLPVGDHIYIVQEIIPGPESDITLYCCYRDREGLIQQGFTCRKLRQYPPGFGSASLAVSEDLPDTRAISERLISAIGYRGIAATEFKRDPRDGSLKIIEMNPRPSLWFALSTAAGKSVVLAAYHDLAETGVVPNETRQINGVVWRYAMKDTYSSLFYRLKRGFILPPPNISVANPSGKTIDAVYDTSDPKPRGAEWRNTLRKAAHRLYRSGSAAK